MSNPAPEQINYLIPSQDPRTKAKPRINLLGSQPKDLIWLAGLYTRKLHRVHYAMHLLGPGDEQQILQIIFLDHSSCRSSSSSCVGYPVNSVG